MTEITVRRLLVGDQLAERLAKAGLVEARFSREDVLLVFKAQSAVEPILDILAQAGSEVLRVTPSAPAR